MSGSVGDRNSHLQQSMHHLPTNSHMRHTESKTVPQTESCEGKPTESPQPPTMLEVLGEHLYTKVKDLQVTLRLELDVAKITGVLLELGEQQVLKLLKDEQQLKQGVKKVLEHVPEICSSTELSAECDADAGSEEESDYEIEEQLYSCVYELEPAYSAQITGMLLEMGRSQVKKLLGSRTQLIHAVQKARTAFFQHSQLQQNLPENTANPQNMFVGDARQQSGMNRNSVENTVDGLEPYNQCSDGVDGKCNSSGMTAMEHSQDEDEVTEEMQEIGEMVYAEAEQLYPDSAAKLTGMVLDMGKDGVKLLLEDTAKLHNVIHKAFSSLMCADH